MCIRDSVWSAADGERIAPDHVLCQIRANARALLSAERSACLLYTSDAADERSSVDLGGRRIIKKKKSAVRRLKDIRDAIDIDSSVI